MTEYAPSPPVEVQLMQSIVTEIGELALSDELSVAVPVKMRDNYWQGPQMYRGISVYDLGEVYDDGVIGLEDVGYQIGIAMVVSKTTDSELTTYKNKDWRERIRRRFKNVRVTIADDVLTSVQRHVCRVAPGTPTHPKSFNNEYKVYVLVVTVWAREPVNTGS